MEPSHKRKIIQALYSHWESGDVFQAGVLLYERIPRLLRPQWGAELLEVVSRSIFNAPEIEAVIAFARTPEQWADGLDHKSNAAHNFFDAVRHLTLQIERQEKRQPFESVLLLAENVAKVTYNAYRYRAPFDHDAGWWITANLKSIIDTMNNLEFTSVALPALFNEQYVELEAPVRCNPYCGICYLLTAFEI
jgi:hypothetical protein